MIANIRNDGYGWDVTSYADWAAIGNPGTVRYSSNEIFLGTELNNILHTELTGNEAFTRDLDILIDPQNPDIRTGSVEVYEYNIHTDIHDLKYIARRRTSSFSDYLYLTSETSSIIDTETSIDIILDNPPPIITPLDDDYGISVDINRNLLAVGCLYGVDQIFVETPPTGSITNITYSNAVDLYDLSKIDISDPYLITIPSPNPFISESFGYKVSLNDEWLAISSIHENSNIGCVHMYRNGGNYSSWSLYQTISASSECVYGDYFGWSIHMNKFTGSYSGSMIVGTKRPAGSLAHIYEFISGSWINTFTLGPDLRVKPLNFYPTYPLEITHSTADNWENVLSVTWEMWLNENWEDLTGSMFLQDDSFGFSVAMYKDSVVVGAPTDRDFYEYPGSSLYKQGSVYFYERCPNRERGYYLVRKSYGNEQTLKNNKLGYSVDIWDSKTVVGCPRESIDNTTLCFIKGSLFQKHYCSTVSDINVIGQYILYTKDTGSNMIDWDIINVFQKRKRLYFPYRDYGNDVSICKDFIVVGSPMKISGSSRQMDLSNLGSFTGSFDNIEELCGKGYIYNLNNLRDNFYVGNVFYRNGKIVIMESGSSLSELLLNAPRGDEYQYTLNFQSKQTLYEKQIVCTIDPGEFNVSTNPTSILPITSSFDLNKNGVIDFQDIDILLRLMEYKMTFDTINGPSTDWSSSLLFYDDEISLYNIYSSSYVGTDVLFNQYLPQIDTILSPEFDLNNDNSIDLNDQNILWKYFSNRLTQKNYETYITPNSQRKYLSDILDYMNIKLAKNQSPKINPNFFDYSALSKVDPTGSYLKPYATTIGLYSGCDLVAVAKLGSPIKIVPNFPLNFIIKMDF